jgi:hypothetical protein
MLSIFVNESVENPQLREAATRWWQCLEKIVEKQLLKIKTYEI